jgi:hypothetical protein
MEREKTNHHEGGPPPDCSWVQKNLGACIDGELPPAERRAVAGHLDGCPGCRELQIICREDWSLLEGLPGPSTGGAASAQAFLKAVKERLAYRQVEQGRRRRIQIVSLLAVGSAAAAALFLIGSLFFRDGVFPPQSPQGDGYVSPPLSPQGDGSFPANSADSMAAAEDRLIIQNLPVLEAIEKEIGAASSGDGRELQSILDSLAILEHADPERESEGSLSGDDFQDDLELLLSEDSEG